MERPPTNEDLYPESKIRKDSVYFAITFGADSDGKMWSGAQTYWVGFSDEEHRIEIRQIRPIDPDWAVQRWKFLHQPFHVVNTNLDFVRWMFSGGHALISKEQTEKHLPDELEPRKCVCEGASGFTDLSQLPKTAFQKAPTPKLRMTVLKRDKFRCMICGQRPADDVNIQLHTHHIRPHAKRGITTEKNLISLCHTCHAGLEPHYEFSLFSLIDKRSENCQPSKEYLESVRNYRNAMQTILKSLDTNPT